MLHATPDAGAIGAQTGLCIGFNIIATLTHTDQYDLIVQSGAHNLVLCGRLGKARCAAMLLCNLHSFHDHHIIRCPRRDIVNACERSRKNTCTKIKPCPIESAIKRRKYRRHVSFEPKSMFRFSTRQINQTVGWGSTPPASARDHTIKSLLSAQTKFWPE